MCRQSFVKLQNVEDVVFFKKMLDIRQYEKLLRGLWNKKRYVFYPELNVVINEFNENEIYVLKEEKLDDKNYNNR